MTRQESALPSPEAISHVDQIDRRCIQLKAVPIGSLNKYKLTVDPIFGSLSHSRNSNMHTSLALLSSELHGRNHARWRSSPPLTCLSACARSSTTRALLSTKKDPILWAIGASNSLENGVHVSGASYLGAPGPGETSKDHRCVLLACTFLEEASHTLP